MSDPISIVVRDTEGLDTLFVRADATAPQEPCPPCPPCLCDPEPNEDPQEGAPVPPLSADHFTIFQTRNGVPAGHPDRLLWEFVCDRQRVADLPVTPRGASDYGHVAGFHHWADGDRISYGTAWAIWMHEDTHHAPVPGFRFQWQDYGGTNSINDRGMTENPFGAAVGETQGLPPYPYERVAPLAVDLTRPGGEILLVHKRNSKHQLLGTVTIPAIEPRQPKTRWYYQLNGLFVAVNEDVGVVAKLIVSSLAGMGGAAPAYSFRISGVPTAASGTYPTRL